MRTSKRRRLASLDAMDVATRFVNAANQHDTDGLIACVHRNFQSIQPAHPARNFMGVGQLRSNWEAIFRTEPGFRLTVLRATVEDETVWLELHGAGDNAEAAGTFILAIEDGRIRWIRVYSDLVEPDPDGEAEVTAVAPLAAVPDLADDGEPSGAEVTNGIDPEVVEAVEPAVAEAAAAMEWGDDGDDGSASDTAAEPEMPAPPEPADAGAERDPAPADEEHGGSGEISTADGDEDTAPLTGEAVVEPGSGDEDEDTAPRRRRLRLLRGKPKD